MSDVRVLQQDVWDTLGTPDEATEFLDLLGALQRQARRRGFRETSARLRQARIAAEREFRGENAPVRSGGHNVHQ